MSGGPATVAPAQMGPSKAGRHWQYDGFLFVLPIALLWLVWDAYPTVYSLYLSLTDWDLLGPKRFIGFANYRAMWNDPNLLQAVVTTGAWLLLTVTRIDNLFAAAGCRD